MWCVYLSELYVIIIYLILMLDGGVDSIIVIHTKKKNKTNT